MEIITIETPSLGDRSYVVHDGTTAFVVDPQRDVDRVLEVLETNGLTVAAILETHVHNDYVSGGLVLARLTASDVVHSAGEPVRFDHRAVSDGQLIEGGAMRVTALDTPGHTPHHLSYLVEHDGSQALFTGGSLLYGSVGRTDLIGDDQTVELTRAQFRSARRLAEVADPDAAIYPTHGFGSFCSSSGSAGTSDGTMSGELDVNVVFDFDDEDAFVEHLIGGLSSYPAYYAQMRPLNLAGVTPADLSPPAPVDPSELARRIHRGDWVVDLRARRVFAHEHLVGTIGVELGDSFSTYLGWLIPWGTMLTLLGESADQVADAQRQLVRIGLDRPAGARVGRGPVAWAPEHDVRAYSVVEFADLGGRPDGVVLDVRRRDERLDAHIDGSLHIPLDELLARQGELPEATLLVHCKSGFRASIAASLLDRAGHTVALVDDDFENAAASGFAIVN